jgi:hypothetical protein
MVGILGHVMFKRGVGVYFEGRVLFGYMEDQILVFISLRNRVAQLYP